MADSDTTNGVTKTIFNDPDKLARTKQNLESYAEPAGTDYGEKLKQWMGISDAPAQPTSRQQFARQMVYRNR